MNRSRERALWAASTGIILPSVVAVFPLPAKRHLSRR
jgi:hypothetical protein